MPKPGDEIILTSTLLPTYGVLPASHSCDVSVYEADGTPKFTGVAMVNVAGAVYKHTFDSSGWGLGAYYAIYEAIMDGIAAPPICENFYLELSGIEPSDLDPILDALAIHDADIKTILAGLDVTALTAMVEQIWYTTWLHKQESLSYDSQGRTSQVITTFSEFATFSPVKAIFTWSFTYNADNSIATLTVERTAP